MSHVPNSQRKLFMKWKNIFCEIKIAFVDPGDIVVISVSDAAKAIIDILPSPEPSLALRGLWLPWKQLLLLQSLFWGHWKCLHLEISSLQPGTEVLAGCCWSLYCLVFVDEVMNSCHPLGIQTPLAPLGWWEFIGSEFHRAEVWIRDLSYSPASQSAAF